MQRLKLIWNLCRPYNTDVPSCTAFLYYIYSPDTIGYLSTFNFPTTDICIVVWRSYITKSGWLVESWVGYGGCGNHSFFTSCSLISGLIWIVAFGWRGQKLHIIITVLYVLYHIQIDPVWDMHAISLPLLTNMKWICLQFMADVFMKPSFIGIQERSSLWLIFL